MLDLTKRGTDWEGEEVDEIVADYFTMLKAELAGQPYVKSWHNQLIAESTGRSRGSVEFKYQNISAVLDELGMPWISGYKPRANYQNVIFEAIDRFLSLNPDAMMLPPTLPTKDPILTDVFVDPPESLVTNESLPERLRILIDKFDPVERDFRNRSLGKAGEGFVVDLERSQLAAADRLDLARRVRWVAAEDGDGAGYDVLSFDPKGQERLLEVKTTNGAARTPFFLTRNEREVAMKRPEEWRLYRVHMFAKQPKVFALTPPLEDVVRLRPELWRVSFSAVNSGSM